MTKGCDVRRHSLQGNANVSRQLVRGVTCNEDLHKPTTAFKLDPNPIALSGDHRFIDVQGKLQSVSPLSRPALYRAGVSDFVTQVDDARAFDKGFTGFGSHGVNSRHSRDDNVQLFAQSKRSVWRKRDIDAPGLNANGTGKPGNLRLSADKGTRHLTKLSSCERPRATPVKAVTRVGVSQEGSGILLCIGRAPLQIGRLELHFIGHFHQLCRARAQACRLGQALVTLCPRQSTGPQVNHIHFPASYSRAHSARLVAGVTPEAKGNTP